MLNVSRSTRWILWPLLTLLSVSRVWSAPSTPAQSVVDNDKAPIKLRAQTQSSTNKGGATGHGYTWADVARWPDFQGNWAGGGLGSGGGGMGGGMGAGQPGEPGSDIPLTPEFKAAAAKAQTKQAGIGDCEPMGVISDSGGSFYFSKDVIIIGGLSDWYNVWRRVYMDGRGHPDDVEPSYFGHSIGHWEGNTLVIDTVGIRGEAQIMQGMHIDSTATHIVERLRLIDKDTLEMKRVITNPEVFSGPWASTKTMKRTDEEYYESYCWTDRDEVLGGDLKL